MISHFIDFFVEYFTHLNIPKIIGGILALLGTAIMGKVSTSGDPNAAILYGIAGILVSGIGLAIIYFDMSKDKSRHNFNELETLNKALEQNNREKGQVVGWNMNQEPGKKSVPDSKDARDSDQQSK